MSNETGLKLTAEMKNAINNALTSGTALAIAYVDENHSPHLSFRGSTQTYSDTQLAIWVRNPNGRILDATRNNPSVALIYGNFNPETRGFLTFRGRAAISDDATVRNRVYTQAHEFEQKQDPERKGVALIIDLDSVEGFFGGARIQMRSG